MHSQITINQFIDLRAQGLSLNRIADQLGVSKRTLVDWNRDHQATIDSLRALELEALHERVLASHEQELTRLAACQSKIDEELAKRSLETVPTDKLLRLSLLVRQEIRALRQPQFAGSAGRAATGVHETNGQSSPIKVNQAENILSPQPPSRGRHLPGADSQPAVWQCFQPADHPPAEAATAESSPIKPDQSPPILYAPESSPFSESPISQSKIENQKSKMEHAEHCLECGEPLPALLPDGTRPSLWCATCSSPIAAPPGLSIRELCPVCSTPIPVHGYNTNRFSTKSPECDAVLPSLDGHAALKWLPPDSKLQAHASPAI